MKSHIFFALLLILVGCSTKRPEGATEAEVLFKEAKNLITDGRFIQANEKLNSIRSQYPYSYYATHAELLQADILFSQENFVESASAYILFKDFHPKYQDMGYVISRISESFYKQLPSTYDRDLSPGIEALKYYAELLNNYPQTEYAKDATAKVERIKKMLEQKEIYIADFYFKTKSYEAAKARYQDIVDSITDVNEKERISIRLVEVSKILNDKASCEKFYKQLSSNVVNQQSKFNNVYQECINN